MLTFPRVRTEAPGCRAPPLHGSAVLQHIALPGMAQLAGGCQSARRKGTPRVQPGCGTCHFSSLFCGQSLTPGPHLAVREAGNCVLFSLAQPGSLASLEGRG